MTDVTNTAGMGRRRRESGDDPVVDRELAEELVERAGEQGVELLGEDGLLRQMTKAILERALAAELTEHLGYEPHERSGSANARNGSTPKRLHTEAGTVGAQTAFEREVQHRRGEPAGTEDYLDAIGDTRPTLTEQALAEFEEDIATCSRL